MLDYPTKTVYIRGKTVTLEFFEKGAELSLNSVNAGESDKSLKHELG